MIGCHDFSKAGIGDLKLWGNVMLHFETEYGEIIKRFNLSGEVRATVPLPTYVFGEHLIKQLNVIYEITQASRKEFIGDLV